MTDPKLEKIISSLTKTFETALRESCADNGERFHLSLLIKYKNTNLKNLEIKDIKIYQEIAYDLCKIDSEINRDRKALERAKEAETEAAFDEVIYFWNSKRRSGKLVYQNLQIYSSEKNRLEPDDPKTMTAYIKFVSATNIIMQQHKSAIGEETDTRIDPLTKGPLYNPVRNVMCGHVYGKDSVNAILSQSGRLR